MSLQISKSFICHRILVKFYEDIVNAGTGYYFSCQLAIFKMWHFKILTWEPMGKC